LNKNEVDRFLVEKKAVIIIGGILLSLIFLPFFTGLDDLGSREEFGMLFSNRTMLYISIGGGLLGLIGIILIIVGIWTHINLPREPIKEFRKEKKQPESKPKSVKEVKYPKSEEKI